VNSGKSFVRDEYDRISRIRLSAKTGEGIEFLRQALLEAIVENSKKLSERAVNNNIEDGLGGCTKVRELF